MSKNNITINELVNIESNYHLGVKARDCASRMKIGKDKAYRYYKNFEEGKSVQEIYSQYQENKRKCGRTKLVLSEAKLLEINVRLDNDWSLDAIAGRDKLEKAPERYSTSKLYNLANEGVIDKHKLRRKGLRKWTHKNETRGKINVCNTIGQRDEKYPEIADKKTFGHFEGDTIVGKERKSAVVTLAERLSKYIVLLKASRKSIEVETAVIKWSNNIKKGKVKTVTFDRGKEFARWKEIEEATSLEIYFGDPGSPGQRGLNENSNGIVRKDLPKGEDLSKYSQEELNKIADKWNNIPRKILKYKTPSEVLKLHTGLDTILLHN